MPEYVPDSAYTLTPSPQRSGRHEPLLSGQTLAHLAVDVIGRAYEFPRMCTENGVIDPIPFDRDVPWHLAAMSVRSGQMIAIPQDVL